VRVAADSEGSGGGSGAATDDDAGTGVAAIARAGEPDRYLAALLAPAPEREALLALAALATELARIPLRVVREPVMGEIRLEWWRKALLSAEGDSAGHSVADAMRAAVGRYDLPAAVLDGMIDARALDLTVAPFADDAALEDYLWRAEGALFALAGRILGLGADKVGDNIANRAAEGACRAAGHAYGLTRLLLGLPRSLSLGRVPLAATQVTAAGLSAHELLAGAGRAQAEVLLKAYIAQIRGSLAVARRHTAQLSRRARVAFLPLALVASYVRQLERQGGGALSTEVQILPLTRVWRIAAAHLSGRV
jgi:phytoene synthase